MGHGGGVDGIQTVFARERERERHFIPEVFAIRS